MKSSCLTCKRHVYDLDEMAEYCICGQENKDACTMYAARHELKHNEPDRYQMKQLGTRYQ